MLLEFKFKNYKSFSEEASFSMIPAPKQKGLDFSILKNRMGRKVIKGLSSSVIYGPNASGKTNIIGAMDTFKSIILRGNIRNVDLNNWKSPNPASALLELVPNNKLKEAKPVEFYIDFIEQGNRIQYVLIVDLGLFLDQTFKRKIIKETLTFNGIVMFERSEKLMMEYSDKSEKIYPESVVSSFSDIKRIAEESLNSYELFLMNGFKLMFSRNIAEIVENWISTKFMVIYKADSMKLIKSFTDSQNNDFPQKKSLIIEEKTYEAARIFGTNANAIGYAVNDDDSEANLCSIFNYDDGKSIGIPAELFESYGTIRFINIFPLILIAIRTGGTLVIDEFDASIHPAALMNIINIFHNDEINKNNAQLIFNTHNPIFLNSNLLRRDEIKFVERDDYTHESTLYCLSDFGTNGKTGVRNNDDYMKNYFINQYGAIKNIDFSPLFENTNDIEGEGN